MSKGFFSLGLLVRILSFETRAKATCSSLRRMCIHTMIGPCARSRGLHQEFVAMQWLQCTSMYQHVPVPARPGSLPDHDDWPWLAGAFPGHCGTSLATSAGLCRGSQIQGSSFWSPHGKITTCSWRSKSFAII